MSKLNVVLIQQSWETVRTVGADPMELFLFHLVHKMPAMRSLMPGRIEHCAQQVLVAITGIVESLENVDRLVPMAREMGQRLAAQGVDTSHYQTARESFLLTLEWYLGDKYTADMEQAWHWAWQALSSIALRAAAERTSVAA